jgi:hypothetical protein
LGGAGTYYVVCTSTPTCGSATVSNEVVVTVTAALSAVSVTSASAQSICVGASGTQLTVAETGGGTITGRQWGKRTTSGSTITAISGSTASTFTPSSTNLGGAGTYYVVCTSTPTCGSATVSNEVTVTVNALPAISGQSTALQNVCLNGTAAAMTVTATGANITYQWYSNTTASNTGGTTLGTATGAQTSSYTPLTTTAGTKYYYCIVSGTCTPAVTSAVSGAITVIAVPTISSFTPTSGTVGTTVTITGTNFNTTAGNNSVYFGATKASVSAATATSLTVTVPTGFFKTFYHYIQRCIIHSCR